MTWASARSRCNWACWLERGAELWAAALTRAVVWLGDLTDGALEGARASRRFRASRDVADRAGEGCTTPARRSPVGGMCHHRLGLDERVLS